MKFSIAALACAAQLALYARPATNSHLVNATQDSWPGDKTGCDNKQVQRDVNARCVMPGDNNRHHITCWSCNWWGGDAHPVCTIPCCDPSASSAGNVCGCTHAGKSYRVGYKPNDARKCCATDRNNNPKWDGDACSCADVGAKPQHGAVETDCCSGTWDAKKKCVKAQPNKKNRGMRPQDCVTGKLTADGSCAPGKPGEPVSDPKHCMSGKADRNGSCLCVHAGQKHKKPQACCSGKHEDGTDICACMPNEYNLHHGANKDDCCSEQAHGGRCLCGMPGRPVKKGRGAHGCCAGHAFEKGGVAHCGCATNKTSVTADKHGQCCGGFYDGPAGSCACIKSAHLVASFVPPEACCSGKISDTSSGPTCV